MKQSVRMWSNIIIIILIWCLDRVTGEEAGYDSENEGQNAVQFVRELQTNLRPIIDEISRRVRDALRQDGDSIKSQMGPDCERAVDHWMEELDQQKEWSIKGQCFYRLDHVSRPPQTRQIDVHWPLSLPIVTVLDSYGRLPAIGGLLLDRRNDPSDSTECLKIEITPESQHIIHGMKYCQARVNLPSEINLDLTNQDMEQDFNGTIWETNDILLAVDGWHFGTCFPSICASHEFGTLLSKILAPYLPEMSLTLDPDELCQSQNESAPWSIWLVILG